MILIVASPTDLHARLVMKELRHLKADVTLLDLSKFRQPLELAVRYGSCDRDCALQITSAISLPLNDFRVIWWRYLDVASTYVDKSHAIRVNTVNPDVYQQFADLSPAMDIFWVNHPTRNATATNQAHFLRVSQEVGLGVPATLIANNLQEIQNFISNHQATYKIFSATEEGWQEILVPIDNLLIVSHRPLYNSLVLQETVYSQFDVKVAVVGEEIFGVAFYTSSNEDSSVELKSTTAQYFELPDVVKTSIWQLMSKLGLVYATIHLRLTPKDEWVILGLNPVGDWLSFEERTQQPITNSLANLLVACDR